ncbi:hypothetical protein JCM8547_003367 [Rhodosporidiobolus lusitaniae]
MASSPPYAVVTFVSSDSYLPGALTSLQSLLDVDDPSKFDTVCLVTPSTVGHRSIQALEKAFNLVVGVETIATESWEELKLLGRRDLALTLTKLHLFRLTQYDKVLFLDADTLVLRPLSHLFDLPYPFAAAPDQGWPDAFNSGVMLCTPSQETFDALVGMMKQRGTWDGGDQGLLNDFFPNWHRLSFTYNVTPSAYYTYAPAYKRHGQDASVIHFIGADKPWNRGSRSVYDPEAASKDYYGLVNQWYDVFERHFGTVSTWDVASRVAQPPASFRSRYTSLPHLSLGEKASLESQPATPTSPIPTISINPPSSSHLPPPVPIAHAAPPLDVSWDPSRSSPPRDGGFQMRDSIPLASNAWDDPSSPSSRQRFEPPPRYPSPPRETHDWYKDIMKTKPDPSAVKPVFPWEMPAVPPTPSGKTPARPEPPKPTRTFSEERAAQVAPTSGFRSSASTFTNAWDAVPGIKRYAEQLSKRGGGNGQGKKGSSGESSKSGSGEGGAGASRSGSRAGRRQSGGSASGKELQESVGLGFGAGGGGAAQGGVGGAKTGGKKKNDGDHSSRDGDDEEDEDADVSTSATEEDDGNAAGGSGNEDDSEEEDRIKIRFRQRPTSGELSPTNRRSKSTSSSSPEQRDGQGNPLPPTSPGVAKPPRKDSRYVPTSPRQSRIAPSPSASAASSSPHTSALSGTSPYLSIPGSSPSAGSLRLQIPSGSTPRAGPPSPRNGTSAALSPRAQAVRNAAHARLVSSGSGIGGNAPPVVRATRVFRPETDTGVVKQQGLAALQRFVENMEAASTMPGQQGEGEGQEQYGAYPQYEQQQQQQQYGGGGNGSGGAFRW